MKNYTPIFDQEKYDTSFSQDTVTQIVYATEETLTLATQITTESAEVNLLETLTGIQYFNYLHANDDMT